MQHNLQFYIVTYSRIMRHVLRFQYCKSHLT